jgi:cyclic pyranopterin phosphate synthase
LRLSITDVCNFRCEYCLPNGYQKGPRDFLTLAEIRRLIAAFAELGIRKLRITGGEPLVRRDVTDIVRAASATPGIERLAITTNAYRLAPMVDELVESGLHAVNISLDSLHADTYHRITGAGERRHADVMEAIEASLEAGFASVKVNAVLLAGVNDHELPDFIEYVRTRPVSVRFIELMQTRGNEDYFASRHVRGALVAEQLAEAGWTEAPREKIGGPAIEYRHPDYAGRIGLIQPYAPHFCDDCNRLRVTATGGLRLCLFGTGTHDLRPLLASDDMRDELKHSIVSALFEKGPAHALALGNPGDIPNLAMTGG